MKICNGIFTAVLALVLVGCASSKSGSVFSRDQARTVHTVKTGIVESVRQVQIEGTQTPVGAIAGGAIGGIAGGGFGGGRTSSVTTILGALAGGLVGGMAEEAITRKSGLEITVRLDGGGLVAIVQEADETFTVGQAVRIIQNGSTSRVTP